MNPSEATVEELQEKRNEVINSISEETNLNHPEDKQMIKNSLDYMILEEKMKTGENDVKVGNSIVEDIKSTLFDQLPSRGMAEVTGVRVPEENIIEIQFTIVGTDEVFSQCYLLEDTDEERLKSMFKVYDAKPNEELKKLYKFADSTYADPKSIMGKTVPVKKSNSKYDIYYPPEEKGLGKRMIYELRVIVRKHNLVGYNPDAPGNDNIKPNKSAYALALLGFITAELISSISFPISVVLFAITGISFALMCAIHMFYADSRL